MGERIGQGFYRPIEATYLRILRFSMAHRWIVVVASILSFVSLFPLGAIAKKGFLPVDDRAQFEVNVRAPEGSSIATTTVYGERIADEIRQMPHVALTLVSVGDNDQRDDNVARVFVRLDDPRDRDITQDEFMEKVRLEVLSKQPAFLRTSASLVSDFGGSGNSTAHIQYNLVGPELEKPELCAPEDITVY